MEIVPCKHRALFSQRFSDNGIFFSFYCYAAKLTSDEPATINAPYYQVMTKVSLIVLLENNLF